MCVYVCSRKHPTRSSDHADGFLDAGELFRQARKKWGEKKEGEKKTEEKKPNKKTLLSNKKRGKKSPIARRKKDAHYQFSINTLFSNRQQTNKQPDEVAHSVDARAFPHKTAYLRVDVLRYSPDEPHYELGPVHASLYVRVT